jgi:hypothetical protein
MNSHDASFAGGKISLVRETGLTETRRAEKREFRTQKLKKRAISTPHQPNRRSPSALAGINTRCFDDPAHPRLDLGRLFRFDRLNGLTFEVVPGFLNTDDSYTFPDANGGGRWCMTNPRPEISAIRTRNAACNGNLVPLCGMMRAWKRKWDVPIGGLLVDTLAYQFIENWEHRDKSYLYYDFMCRDFFDFMANQDKEKEYWRAPGSGQHVYGKGLFQWKSRRCHNLALEAVEHETAQPKREWSAKQKWREIFGNKFPE